MLLRNDTFMPMNNSTLKTFLMLFLELSSVLAANSLLYLLPIENGCHEVIFEFGKRKKSAGAISGEYGGCSMVFAGCVVKYLITIIALCDGALSWHTIKEFSSHKSGFFVKFTLLNAALRSNNIPYLPFDFPARIQSA
jgi:hypothetical protein